MFVDGKWHEGITFSFMGTPTPLKPYESVNDLVKLLIKLKLFPLRKHVDLFSFTNRNYKE
jgi:hypothetical protein